MMFWRIAGVQPHPEMTLRTGRGPRLPTRFPSPSAPWRSYGSDSQIEGRSGEQGAALLELALVLPLLLVVIAGIVDFGFAFQRYEVSPTRLVKERASAAMSGYDAAAVQAAGAPIRQERR